MCVCVCVCMCVCVYVCERAQQDTNKTRVLSNRERSLELRPREMAILKATFQLALGSNYSFQRQFAVGSKYILNV